MRQIAQEIGMAMGTGLASIVVALLIAIQRKILAKLHIQVTAEEESRERSAAEQAVLHAEEWGAKQNADKVKDAGAEKFAKAKAVLLSECPWLSDPMVESLLEATGAKMGLRAAADKIA